ncbi:MAG TPA: monovalent cation/H+ antiporter subunit A [Rubrivivax sp.]|nr:monovalent cation/H+ antiporter subunit A [Rubrivivax sp.]
MSLFLLLALPFAGSLVAALLPTTARNLESILAAAVAAAVAVPMALLYPQIAAGTIYVEHLSWLPALGVDLVVRIDGFAWLFAMLVAGIGLLVVVYARYYLSPADPSARFYSLLLGFMGAMLGVVVSGNLVQLVVFWELTSVFSFLLIGYWTHRQDARRGARMAFTVTASGGLALLAGVLLLGSIVGSFELDAVLAAGDRIRADARYPLMLALLLGGALTKSAQFPFHFWLPHAMAAPTPVSAYLHSATMVKAGVFLLARLWPVLSGTDAWFWAVGGAGLATLLLGAFLAMLQNDLKGLLAYSTISHLGLITLLLGLNSPLAAVAAVFHTLNHATFKASLFMSVGIIDHETGTRDMRRLRGLFTAMPITGTLAIVASAAMAGVPLLNGFLSKEMFFAETVFVRGHPVVELALPALATLAGAFAVTYSLRLAHGVFFGHSELEPPRQPHEPVPWMRVPVELLVLACVLVGTLPDWAIGAVLRTAAAPVVGGPLPAFSLVLWHGWTMPLLMSVFAMATGLVLYLRLGTRLRERGPTAWLDRLDGQAAYRTLLTLAVRLARAVSRGLGTRRLQPQVLAMVLAAGIAGIASAIVVPLSWGDRPRVPATPEFVGLWAIGGVCAIGAAWQAKFHRLAALAMLSVVGLVLCLTFAWFSAPDLALTQLAVEVVTTVLFLLGLRWLPKREEPSEAYASRRARCRRRRDLGLALAVGAGMATLSFALLTRQAPLSIAPFFLEQALPGGGGRNVVNVMLVDFRAFDTLGEITVLGVVGISVFALLRRFRPAREAIESPAQQRVIPADVASDLHRQGQGATQRYLDVPAVLVRLLLPASFAFALHLLLRGHNAPGGGFVAGLVVASALVAQYMVSGTRWVESRLRVLPVHWIAVGLALVLATGLGALVLGYPFLTSHTAHVDWPLLGELELPSAALFDVGVFAVVVGSTLLMLTAIAHQSLRGRRQQAVAGGAEAP